MVAIMLRLVNQFATERNLGTISIKSRSPTARKHTRIAPVTEHIVEDDHSTFASQIERASE
jgi:hypothetical protein